MPIYEYKCDACGEQREFIQKFNEDLKLECPACGELRLRKLISAAAFHLKGSGWYVTDFRDQDKNKAKTKENSKSDPKSEESSVAANSDDKTGSTSSAATASDSESTQNKKSQSSSAADD